MVLLKLKEDFFRLKKKSWKEDALLFSSFISSYLFLFRSTQRI